MGEAERAAQQQDLNMKQLLHDIEMKRKSAEAAREIQLMEQKTELERLRRIKSLDKDGEMAKYLIAKDCQLPPVIQCGTIMSAAGAASGTSSSPTLSGLVQAQR